MGLNFGLEVEPEAGGIYRRTGRGAFTDTPLACWTTSPSPLSLDVSPPPWPSLSTPKDGGGGRIHRIGMALATSKWKKSRSLIWATVAVAVGERNKDVSRQAGRQAEKASAETREGRMAVRLCLRLLSCVRR